MSSYDSDSSLEDLKASTETNVLLGFSSKEPTDDAISHLGGHPVWLDADSRPEDKYGKCKVCQSYMSLLLQLNGDHPSHFPDDQRRLHIFTCRKKQCSRKPGSIRALREVKRYSSRGSAPKKSQRQSGDDAPTQSVPQLQQDLGSALFGTSSTTSNSNPFSTSKSNSLPDARSNPFAPLPPTSTLAAIPPQPPTESFASKLMLSDPAPCPPTSDSSPWPPPPSFPTPYPHLHLDADYELLTPPSPPHTASLPTSSKNKDKYAGYDAPSATSTSERDNFESTLDATFLHFSDILSQNPDQVLRYEFNGRPLLYSGSDDVARCFGVVAGKHKTQGPVQGMPRCNTCGAARVFECQLVPGAISALEEDELGVEEGMEWGTVILGVCKEDCAEVGKVAYREEWVGVQWEERK